MREHMGLIVRNVGVQCDECGTEIAADKPVYVVTGDDDDLVFCSFECLAGNQINFTTYGTVGEYLVVVGMEPTPKKKS